MLRPWYVVARHMYVCVSMNDTVPHRLWCLYHIGVDFYFWCGCFRVRSKVPVIDAITATLSTYRRLIVLNGSVNIAVRVVVVVLAELLQGKCRSKTSLQSSAVATNMHASRELVTLRLIFVQYLSLTRG